MLFLLRPATAPWAEIVTHFSTIPVVSCHNMMSKRDAFCDRTTDYVLFLLGPATATWAEIVTQFYSSSIPCWSDCHNMIWNCGCLLKQYHSCCFLPQHDLKSCRILWQDYGLRAVPSWAGYSALGWNRDTFYSDTILVAPWIEIVVAS